jgi:ABC-2 type transport system permease protein
MMLLRAWTTLFMLSFQRLLWSASTLMVGFPLIGCGLFLWIRRYDEIAYPPTAFNAFSEEFITFIFAPFVIPICALAYATTSIGGDREDRTLLFLLIRPVPRWLILSAKLLATLPLVLGLVITSYAIFCRLGGSAGHKAFELYLPAVFFMTIAYVSLFHLFAVWFRHSTIVALVYALFMEFFIGNMPGIIKRVAVNYYGRSMIYAVGMEEGVQAPDPEWFVPLTAHGAASSMLAISLGGTLLALWIFQRREYRDLT